MSKMSHRYYINLFIAEKAKEFYFESKNISVHRQSPTVNIINKSSYYSWFEYVSTYYKGSGDRPTIINNLTMVLVEELGNVFGFGPNISLEYIIKFFIYSDYKEYLDLVLYRERVFKQI